MTGIEHVAGIYLTNPPAIASPAIGVFVLTLLAAAVAYAWWQEEVTRR